MTKEQVNLRSVKVSVLSLSTDWSEKLGDLIVVLK